MVQFPLKKYDICNQTRNKLSVLVLFLFSMTFYSFSLVISGTETYGSRSMCSVSEKWVSLAKIMSITDVFLTIFVPFGIILFTNISIYCKLMKKYRFDATPNGNTSNILVRPNEDFSTDAMYHSSRLDERVKYDHLEVRHSVNAILIYDQSRRKTVSFPKNERIMRKVKKINSYPELSSASENNKYQIEKPGKKNTQNFRIFKKFSVFTSILRRSVELKRAKMYSKTTRMLIIISITFLFLNSLMAFSKIRAVLLSLNSSSSLDQMQSSTIVQMNENYTTILNSTQMYNTTKEESSERNLNDELIERISCYFYYLNFSLNFFLYVINGSQFREILLKFTKKLR